MIVRITFIVSFNYSHHRFPIYMIYMRNTINYGACKNLRIERETKGKVM